MPIDDIPVFRQARRGQVVRSDDWNGMQRQMRDSLRRHRHTRVAGEPADDGAEEDLALQIDTDDIADGAVTAEKLAPDVLPAPRIGRRAVGLSTLRPNVRARLDGAAQARTGTLALAARAVERVEHGLGAVPVAVILGVVQDPAPAELAGLEGAYEIYGGAGPAAVFAAVPSEPDGTFVLVSRQETEVETRWWAFAPTA